MKCKLLPGLALVVVATERSAAAAAVAEQIFFCRHFKFLKIENYLHRHDASPPFSQGIKGNFLQDGLALVVPATERSTAAAAVAEKLFFVRYFEFLKIENYFHRHDDLLLSSRHTATVTALVSASS